MTSQLYHLAQANIALMRSPLDDPIMAGFVARLAEINALADQSPGFIWRLQTEEGDATYLRPYTDDRVLFNLSVWESVGGRCFRYPGRELLNNKIPISEAS